MNLRVLLILFVFLIWCLLALWWYHDHVICNCTSNSGTAIAKIDSVKKDSVVIKSADSAKISPRPDSTTSVKLHDTLLVYFPSNSIQNNPDKNTMNHIHEMIKEAQSSGKSLEITGHSDSQGKPEKNMELGLKRANRLKDLFNEMGAKSVQIKTLSKGQTEPLGDNSSPEGRAKNRRATVVLQ